MDECMLNDLLECSVCLERLDTSSKVLPCQHTFCKRCLEEIVTTHKELRCPECRILVDAKIDDLPPNVLLMRILEGMRNAPKKQQTQEHNHRAGTNIRTTTLPNTNQSSVIHHHSTTESQQIISTNITDRNQVTGKGQVSQILPHQPYGRALYDYVPSATEDLSFKKGDIILLKKRMDMHWYLGECGGKQGVFPSAFVQIMIPLPCQTPQCKALYDFRMTGEDEEGCLAFNKGAIINVIRRVDENWAEGRLNDRVGIFPLAFVELNSLARSLMKLSTNSQPGPSRIAPPTPTSESNTPLISSDYIGMQSSNITRPAIQQSVQQQQQTQHYQQQQLQQQQQQQPQQQLHQHQPPPKRQSSDSSSTVSSTSPSTTPNTSSSNTSSSSSTAPSSPTSPPPLRTSANTVHSPPPPRPTALHVSQVPSQNLSATNVNQREKRHSFSAMNSNHHHHSSHRHSAEILSTDQNEISQTSQQSSSERHKRLAPNDVSVPPPVPPTQNGSSHHSISNTTNLPAAYIALYPYTPQKPDELELRKGGIYMVTERCQDGWFKGTSNRTQKCGVFPGNYVAPARGVPRGANLSQVSSPRNSGAPPLEPRILTTYTRGGGKSSSGGGLASTGGGNSLIVTSPNIRPPNVNAANSNNRQPPELPPRSVSPAVVPTSTTVSCSWHGQPDSTNAIPLGRSQSAVMTSSVTSPSVSVSTSLSKTIEKPKDRKEKGTVSLMRRLTSMKRSKSPPPTTYSMDNPVFEDNTSVSTLAGQSSSAHPVHVRSGSCPSQLLQALPPTDMNTTNTTTSVLQNVHHRFLATGTLTGSQRIKHKERSHVLPIASSLHSSSSRHGENSLQSSLTSSPNANHRKSNSLDAGSKSSKTSSSSSTAATSQSVRERFRCIVPYPPNSEYELELRLNDIIYVHKKRDDGWYKGTQQRTGRTGLFPASFVESF